MSVVGFDVGNESCIVAVARQRGIDVALNDESKRETPAVVCFGDKQRFIGTAGAASSVMNPGNTVSQVKRLVGRRFNDPELQRDLRLLPFAVTEGPDGFPLIHARYLGEKRTFTPTQVLGMVLSDLKSIAEKNLNAAVVYCCVGIPAYFTDLQRRAFLDAAAIAGLQPLQLLHETTATALAYGIYNIDPPEENDDHELNVAFVDVGHASMQVCIAGFKKGKLMKILAHAWDRCLGGRDFDEALFKHFASEFREEYKIDVYQNARACLRLRAACEKLKKVLSANPEAPLNVECLMDDKDVRGFIRREEFEQISLGILERVKGPLESALSDAGLSVEDIHSVEVVGSGSRVPAIIRILTEFFGKEPRRSLNASECVARGCALQRAILTPTFIGREFQVHENFPFPIALSWKGLAPYSHAENQQSSIVFTKGNPIPSIKALTFYRSSTISVDVLYADLGDLQVPAKISTYTIGPFQSSKGERSKLKLKVRLNLHGIVSVDSATMLEEEEATKMETDETAQDWFMAENDVNMQRDADAKVEPSKKKVKKTYVPVSEVVYGGLPAADLQKAVEQEFVMALQDRVMEETKDKKNAVEAYVYDMRNKLHDKYQDVVTAVESEEISAKLQEVEDWLYEEGEDETKGVYIAKLEELKKQGDPVEERYKQYTERGPASKDAKFDRIELAEKKVVNECQEEVWLPKHATPAAETPASQPEATEQRPRGGKVATGEQGPATDELEEDFIITVSDSHRDVCNEFKCDDEVVIKLAKENAQRLLSKFFTKKELPTPRAFVDRASIITGGLVVEGVNPDSWVSFANMILKRLKAAHRARALLTAFLESSDHSKLQEIESKHASLSTKLSSDEVGLDKSMQLLVSQQERNRNISTELEKLGQRMQELEKDLAAGFDREKMLEQHVTTKKELVQDRRTELDDLMAEINRCNEAKCKASKEAKRLEEDLRMFVFDTDLPC